MEGDIDLKKKKKQQLEIVSVDLLPL